MHAYRCACGSWSSVSYDRPSVCRCRCSSRSGGVPGETSKSSQGSCEGGMRSADLVKAFPCSFTSSASPPPAALTLAASFRIQMQRKLANPYPLTTHLSPRFSHSISASVSFPQHVCIFLSTSPPLIPLLPTTSLLFPSLNVASVTLPVHLHLFLPNPVSPLPPPTHPFSTSLPPVEQNIQQYINPHTSLWASAADASVTGSSCHAEETVRKTFVFSLWMTGGVTKQCQRLSPYRIGPWWWSQMEKNKTSIW